MIILLLFFSQVGCEWVEISQSHYRKEPVHIVHLPNIEYTTKSSRIYINNSVTEKQWHKGVIDKVSNVGNIRRVQHPSVKTSSVIRRYEDNRFNKNFNDQPDTTQAEYDFVSVKPNIQKLANEDYDVFDILNNVTEQTIWSTTADTDHVKNHNSKDFTKIPILTNAFDRRQIFGEKIKEDDFNQRKQVQISKPLRAVNDKELGVLDLNEDDKLHPIGKPNLHKIYLEDELKLDLSKISEKRSNIAIESSRIIQRTNNDYVKVKQEKQNSTNVEHSNVINNYKSHETNTHQFNSSARRDKIDNDVKNSHEVVVNEANHDKPVKISQIKNAPFLGDEETTFSKMEDFLSKEINVTKENSIKGMWKLIKLVTDTIYKNTHRSFKSKINYLETLKATLLASIEDQIHRTWPDDVQQHGSRRTRSAQAQSRGHLEFPSSESTLMTISFLTFAVFVIKLVLQVIHTYKNKAMMVTPTIVSAVGRAAAAIRNKAQNT